MEAVITEITDGAFSAAAGFFGDFAPLVLALLGLSIFLTVSSAFFGFLRR